MRRLRANPDFAREREWVHDRLKFHQQTLSNVLAEIERMEAAV
jgi:ferric-dicitrate binding protein FerR (iron transport regulator)